MFIIHIIIAIYFFLIPTADFVQTCSIKDPEFESCSKESIQKLFKKLVTGTYQPSKLALKMFRYTFKNFQFIGIDGLQDLDTIDPMKLAKIKIFQGDGPVSINSTLSKSVVTGFADTHVISSRFVRCIVITRTHFDYQ